MFGVVEVQLMLIGKEAVVMVVAATAFLPNQRKTYSDREGKKLQTVGSKGHHPTKCIACIMAILKHWLAHKIRILLKAQIKKKKC